MREFKHQRTAAFFKQQDTDRVVKIAEDVAVSLTSTMEFGDGTVFTQTVDLGDPEAMKQATNELAGMTIALNEGALNEGAIPSLTFQERLDLTEDIHRIVVRFMDRRASSLCDVVTLRVSDIVSDLTDRQARWLMPRISLMMLTDTEQNVLKLPIDVLCDPDVKADEIFIINRRFNWGDDKNPVGGPMSVRISLIRLTIEKTKRSELVSAFEPAGT